MSIAAATTLNPAQLDQLNPTGASCQSEALNSSPKLERKLYVGVVGV